MPPPSSPPHGLPNVGDLLAGKYRIEKLLGMGGMGAVYGANHEILGQKVAIKVLLAEIAANQEAVLRFQNEARAAAKIQNIHCARVTDVGTLEHGQAYMVMEYLEGCDLGQLLERNGPLPIANAVDYVLQALEALAHAHSLQLVHRDLKPANLFLARQQDGTDIVKVLDFGISKATNGPGGGTNPSLTSTKALLGSPLYMSPEQLRSSKSVDPRADVWALGIILFELLTGRTPYDGDNVGELFAAILERDAPSVRTFRPDVPPGLDQAVLACLRRDPNHRLQDVGQLADALVAFASPAGALSAEHVRRSLAALTGNVAPAPLGAPRTSGPGPGQSGSIGASVSGDPVVSTGGSGKTLGIVALGIAMLAAAFGTIVMVTRGHSGETTTAVASGSASAPAPPLASPSAVPASPPSATSDDAGSKEPSPPGTAASTRPAPATGSTTAGPVPKAPRPLSLAATGPKAVAPAVTHAPTPAAPTTAYDPTKDKSAQ